MAGFSTGWHVRSAWVLLGLTFCSCTRAGLAFGETGAALSPAAVPDDQYWAEGFGWPGVDGTVSAIASYRGELVIAGQFTDAGGVRVNHIARWNGVTWRPLGQGLRRTDLVAPTIVSSLAVLGDELVAAGSFNLAGSASAQNIARWNGTTWAPLGLGLNNTVYCLATWNGGVVAGGNFTHAGGVLSSAVAMWRDGAWSSLGGEFDDAVEALTEHDGNLYASGLFTSPAEHLARWDGSTWSAFPTVPIGAVGGLATSLASFRGELVLAGYFHQVDGISTPGIAAWNGSSWRGLGTGLGGYGLALAVLGDRLYVGGQFAHAGGVAANGIAQWDGAAWSALATRTGRTGGSSIPMVVKRLGVWDGDLIVAGDFDVAEEVMAVGLARWDGAGWWPLGWGLSDAQYQSWVSCFAEHDGRLIMAGRLAHQQSGALPSVDIRAWNDTTMDVLEWRVSGQSTPLVNALAVYQGDLVAAGSFIVVGGDTVDRIARWDGVQWHSLGLGANSTIEALRVWRGDLIAAGRFTSIGGVPAQRVARWDGTAWSELGEDVSGDVTELAELGGDLVAGGLFTLAGGEPANHIARWDGTGWHPLGTGLSAPVHALAVHEDHLIAGGEFLSAGGTETNHVAAWNGVTWSPLGAGTDGIVLALASRGTELVAGGQFMQAGDSTAPGIARWDGARWRPLGSGVRDPGSSRPTVFGLHVRGERLFVGGLFDEAGGKPAYNIATWSAPPSPRAPRGPNALESNYPNPFAGATTFTFRLAAPGTARLSIHDLQGRIVATVANGAFPAGENRIAWLALHDDGTPVRSGIYFARLAAPQGDAVRKIVIVK